ncbi:RING finger protein 37 [Dermacentor andersoni]|uniref:RING finger protein 37 n=1 Tax=Dermacentor andersoni TaxID=34620 RepID=UPI00215551E4|nr:RING finger protein 37-like [Dermacentor andersoni]
MAIDFCSKNVGTLIEADQICADGYDVGNLISADRRRCGFMAEYFIKPPVTVLLTLPCPTELSCVVVGLIRGPVKLTGFEIWVSHTGVGATSPPQDDFVLVGKKYEATGDVVQLRNRCYVPRGPFASLMRDGRTPSFAYDSHGTGETLKTAYCKYVCRIKLKLTRAMGSASIGLGSLQVWGQPMAALCSLAAQDELIRQFLSSSETVPNFSHEHSATDQRRLHQTSSSASTVPEQAKSCALPPKSQCEQKGEVTTGEFQIPTDFQDALTFELMTQPVVLPSGQVVDQSTLDKHVDTEEKWGRPPTDPFTGITLTGINCPKSLPELKSRIDHFVVRNLEQLGNIPRTLGGSPAGAVISARPSGLISLSHSERPSSCQALNESTACVSTKDETCSSQNCRRPSHLNAFNSQGSKAGITGLAGKLGAATSSTSNLVNAHSSFDSVDQRVLQGHRIRKGAISKLSVSPTTLPKAMPVPQLTKQHAAFMSDASSSSTKQKKLGEGEKRKLESEVNVPEAKQPRCDLKTHEERLADSLSSSLAETLQRIRNSAQQKRKVQETDGDLCWACKVSQSTHRVPCGHHFCRSCLMNTVRKGQCTCGKLFQSSEVVRVHCSEQNRE